MHLIVILNGPFFGYDILDYSSRITQISDNRDRSINKKRSILYYEFILNI